MLKVEFLFIFVALVLWVVSLCVCLEYANVSLFRPLCNRLMAAPLRSPSPLGPSWSSLFGQKKVKEIMEDVDDDDDER